MLGEMVETVAMDHQQPAAIDGDMDEAVAKFHVAEGVWPEWPEEFVMVPGDIEHARASFEHPENASDDVAGGVVPEKASLHFPTVDDVADEVEAVGLEMTEEIEEPVGL
jgi:hypothetical protein